MTRKSRHMGFSAKRWHWMHGILFEALFYKFDVDMVMILRSMRALIIASLTIIPKLSPHDRHIINNLSRVQVKRFVKPKDELRSLVRGDLYGKAWGPSLADADQDMVSHANSHMIDTSHHIIHYLLVAYRGY